MNIRLLTWAVGTHCVGALHAIAFLRRQGPGRFDPEARARTIRRLEHLAVALAIVAGHYGDLTLRRMKGSA